MNVLTRMNFGGPARQAISLRPHWADVDVEEVLVAGTVDAGEADLAAALDLDGVERVPELVRAISPVSDLAALRLLRGLIRRHRPDVVHTHMSKAGMLGRLAAHKEAVPLIAHTFHGHVFEGYFRRPTEIFIESVERRLASKTDVMVAVGEEVRRDLQRHRVARSQNVEVVHLGLDLASLLSVGPPGGPLRAALGLPSSAPVVGFMGRFAPIKRLDVWLEVAARLAQQLPDVHFILAGGGPEGSMVEHAIAADTLLKERVHLLGWTTDLAPFYEAVDAVLLTSAAEGTPVALIEAAVAGRFVVAFRAGGVDEVVSDGSTGYVVEPTTEAAVRALRSVLSAGPPDRGMSDELRKSVLTRFEPGEVVRRLGTIYEDHLSSGRSKRRRG